MRKIFVLLLIASIGYSCSQNGSNLVKAPTRVKAETVSSANGNANRVYVGTVEENQATAVSFTSMGMVTRVYVTEGQPVRRGQLIAVMDDTQARNFLIGAEAGMQQANDALQRYGMLHENGSLPEVKWVEVQSKVAQAKSQLQIARKNLADCSLTAPVNGIIGKVSINAGETALPSQTVATILDISKVKVKVSVPDTEISSIAENTPSSVRVDAIDMTFDGGKIEKGVQADMLTRTYDIRISVQNPGGKLLPGMVASVSFNSLGQSGALCVPVSAVQKRTDGSAFVWTISQDSTAHRTNVKTGQVSGNDIIIEDGIYEGTLIVTEGYQKLGEGSKVIY